MITYTSFSTSFLEVHLQCVPFLNLRIRKKINKMSYLKKLDGNFRVFSFSWGMATILVLIGKRTTQKSQNDSAGEIVFPRNFFYLNHGYLDSIFIYGVSFTIVHNNCPETCSECYRERFSFHVYFLTR